MSDFYLHFTLGLPHLYTMLTLYDCTYVLSQHFFLSSSVIGTDHLTWISYSHAVRRNIFHDYASCADHYVASYRYSGHHLYTCAKPYVISYFKLDMHIPDPDSSSRNQSDVPMYGIRNSEQRTHYPRKQLRLHQAQPIHDLHKSFHLPIYNIRNRTKSQVQCEFFLPFFPGSFLLTELLFSVSFIGKMIIFLT